MISSFTEVSSSKPVNTGQRSQVPTAVDNYLGTNLDDALLKFMKDTLTADLIEKYSVLPGPESVKNQESEKSPKEIIKAKKEQDEEKQEFEHTHQFRLIKQCERSTREGDLILPLLGQLNLLRKLMTKVQRNQGSQSPLPNNIQLSLSSLTDVPYQADEGMEHRYGDTDNVHIPKGRTTTWFKPIPESERPTTPEPEWTIPPNDFPEPEHNWANAYATTFKFRETSSKRRRMILGHSSNGSADEQERRSSAKLI
ncbi:hypothetical protein Tco_0511405 [Tanacetum coccineum]